MAGGVGADDLLPEGTYAKVKDAQKDLDLARYYLVSCVTEGRHQRAAARRSAIRALRQTRRKTLEMLRTLEAWRP